LDLKLPDFYLYLNLNFSTSRNVAVIDDATEDNVLKLFVQINNLLDLTYLLKFILSYANLKTFAFAATSAMQWRS